MAKPTWLTCEFVEELQQAAGAGQSVECFVDSLENATLPALLEYGCARRHHPSLAVLPPPVRSSPLGHAFQEVRSELGLRTTGRQKPPPRTITPESQEFHVLEGDDPTTSQDWGEFLVRFRQSIKSVGFDLEKAKGVAAALGEMADNAALHANAPVGILVGYQVLDGAAVCCVADVGDGVLKSLTTNQAYQHVQSHKEAVRLALRSGVSRYGPGRGGLGFYNVFKALTAMSGIRDVLQHFPALTPKAIERLLAERGIIVDGNLVRVARKRFREARLADVFGRVLGNVYRQRPDFDFIDAGRRLAALIEVQPTLSNDQFAEILVKQVRPWTRTEAVQRVLDRHPQYRAAMDRATGGKMKLACPFYLLEDGTIQPVADDEIEDAILDYLKTNFPLGPTAAEIARVYYANQKNAANAKDEWAERILALIVGEVPNRQAAIDAIHQFATMFPDWPEADIAARIEEGLRHHLTPAEKDVLEVEGLTITSRI